ncbi:MULTISPECIES: SMC-Scp complex subunit ScpB [Paenalcaligenes]|uniref:SMC-Scp complex subunit ScpB n=1 Tax=Paenalcaligenes hermetiae TaxID=1157987 RepID=A0ABP9LZA5_9BURK|nr:SMC-Scp complex subunit ScpB [Paenalcaligenes sp.]
MMENEVQRVLEAVLLCAEQPLSIQQLRKAFDPFDLSADTIKHHLSILQQSWQNKGLELVQVANGWRFQSRPDIQPYLLRLQNDRPVRYSRATLETLAIIAWRQPVTRGDIEDIRGVSVSTQIIRTLEDRGWIEVLGYRDAPGKPALFGTTKQFLDDLSLRSIQDLPALDTPQDIDVIQQTLSNSLTVTHGDTPPSVGAETAKKM